MASRVPRLLVELNAASLRTLPLRPVDGFVLSRVDGVTDEPGLAAATGLPLEQVTRSLETLRTHELVAFAGDEPEPEQRAAAPGPEQEDVDLTPEQRARVVELFAILETATHYELLGLPGDADKKSIKRQYYDLAASLHPDRFFRKHLGSYKPKMEAVFDRVTRAHDVLSNKQRRAEYDATLQQDGGGVQRLERASIPQPSPSPTPPPAVPHTAPSPSTPGRSTRPPATPAPSPSQPMLAAAGRAISSPGIEVPTQARRDAFARRLLGGTRPATSPTPTGAPASQRPPAAGPSPLAPVPPADPLRRLYEQGSTARAGAAARLAVVAQLALKRNDPAGAAAAYRQALEVAPADPALRRTLEEGVRLADATLLDEHRRRAVDDEGKDDWKAAAQSWSKLTRLAPGDSEVFARAAAALVRAGGNLHEASIFAQRAVQLAPNEPLHRVTLGQVYLAAGLFKNARRELELAHQHLFGDATILALLKRIPPTS